MYKPLTDFHSLFPECSTLLEVKSTKKDNSSLPKGRNISVARGAQHGTPCQSLQCADQKDNH